MKKVLSIILCLSIVVGLCACSTGKNNNDNSKESKGLIGITTSMYTNE